MWEGGETAREGNDNVLRIRQKLDEPVNSRSSYRRAAGAAVSRWKEPRRTGKINVSRRINGNLRLKRSFTNQLAVKLLNADLSDRPR